MKKKIVCPNDDSHKGYDKIILAYEESDKPPEKIWVFCIDNRGRAFAGEKCNRWIQIEFNEKGGVTTKMMPKGYHFDFEKTPTLIKS